MSFLFVSLPGHVLLHVRAPVCKLHECRAYLRFDCRVTTNLENLEYSGISTNMENSGNSVQPQRKFLTNKIVSVRSNIRVTQQGLGLQMNKVS